MTHSKPMAESEGDFTLELEPTPRFCSQCNGETSHRCQRWESHCGAYTDHKYTCLTCSKVHWVDGPDA